MCGNNIDTQVAISEFCLASELCDKLLITSNAIIDHLHKWCLSLNSNTLYTLASYLCFQTKYFSLECEA